MPDLEQKACIPCQGGIPPMGREEIAGLLRQVPGWEVEGGHHLVRSYPFPDFVSALGFVNRVGQLAEAEGHHPDIYLAWGMVRIQIWTHKIDGLTESDFILAAKIEKLPR